jgi:uncharacterized protein
VDTAESAAPAGPLSVTASEWQRLDPRSIQLGRARGWIAAAVLLPAYSIVVVTMWLPVLFGEIGRAAWFPVALTGVWPVLAAALVWRAHVFPDLHYRYTTWRIDDVGLAIRTGVVWRVEIAVARSRVQHIDVSQGPLERRFGLGTLSIYTAGTEHSQVSLDGLEHGIALTARDRLLPARDVDAV